MQLLSLFPEDSIAILAVCQVANTQMLIYIYNKSLRQIFEAAAISFLIP